MSESTISIQKVTPGRSKSFDRARKRLYSELSPEKMENESMKSTLEQILDRLEKQDEKLNMLDSLAKSQKTISSKLDKLSDIESILNNTVSRLDAMDNKFCEMETNVESVWVEINDLKKRINEKNTLPKLIEKENELSYLQSALIDQRNDLKQEFTRLKDYSQRHNLLFSGIPESRNENCVQIIDEIVRVHMNLPGAWREIDKAHRMGPHQGNGRSRPILVRFTSHRAKELTLSRSSGLRNSPFSVRPHLSEESQRASTVLHKAHRIGKQTDPACRVSSSKIIYKGRPYGIESIKDSGIPLHKIHQRESADAIGFLGYLSPLSNFYNCDILVNGAKHKSVEHYYQIRRAELCNETKLARKLQVMDTAREVKQAVNEFKRTHPGKLKLAEEDDLNVMKAGLVAKFQIPSLRKFLVATGNKSIIECNASDRFWSCGLHLDNRSFTTRSAWTGKNNLGKLIETLRSQINAENRE